MMTMFGDFSGLKHLAYNLRHAIKEDLGPYRETLEQINKIELHAETDALLKQRALTLQARCRSGVHPDLLLVETYALVREAARRTLGLQPFDVQLMTGMSLHEGKIVEMQTGEGKTLAAAFPACLNALAGQGVHVLTFNDYLARRDGAWMGPVYRFLGLTVAHISEGMGSRERKAAYGADITYVTAREAGFDYLRDFLSTVKEDVVHRPFHYAIVDEADSILIDEARIPLVIAAHTPPSGEIAPLLKINEGDEHDARLD